MKRWRALERLHEGAGDNDWGAAFRSFDVPLYASLHPRGVYSAVWALLPHYGLEGCKTQPRSAHEIGDVEQRHNRLKRGFAGRAEYEAFLKKLFIQLNEGRQRHLGEKLKGLRRLPLRRLEACKWIPPIMVSPGYTIRVAHNVSP